YTFGTLKAPTVDTARSQAKAWLEGVKAEAATGPAFAAIWDAADTPLLDRVTATLALGDSSAAKLLADARDPAAAPPKDVPALLRDAKLSPFYRANLALAYAKALTAKRVYEEALDALKTAVPEQVVDPAAYYFHKAVAEHALIQKKDATN